MVDVAERVRMALAEAGHPGALVEWDGPSLCVDGAVPFIDAWRAMEIAWALDVDHSPCCAKCAAVASDLGADGGSVYLSCAAERPLVNDCGLIR